MTDPEGAPFVVRTDSPEGVVRLTLNRGDRFNPLSSGMIAALTEHLDRLADDAAARVVVLAGAGRGFSAGHDLAELGAHQQDGDWQRQLFDDCAAMMLRLTALPQPVVARVHGIAAAAGCQLVSMCDLAVAADDARFALSGITAGIPCSTPVVGVARNVGRKRALELLLLGEMIDAPTALNWGLVNRVVPPASLDAAVDRIAARIASLSATAVADGKRSFYQQVDVPIAAAYGCATPSMVDDVLGADAVEGVAAFLTKRRPVWPSAHPLP